MQHNWIKYKIVYDVHHVKQVNLLIFKVIINSRFKSIKREFKRAINAHCNTKIEFGFFDIEKEKKRNANKATCTIPSQHKKERNLWCFCVVVIWLQIVFSDISSVTFAHSIRKLLKAYGKVENCLF